MSDHYTLPNRESPEEGESLALDTRLGRTTLPLDAAQSVSVSIRERGEGAHGVVADMDATALLTAGVWGR